MVLRTQIFDFWNFKNFWFRYRFSNFAIFKKLIFFFQNFWKFFDFQKKFFSIFSKIRQNPKNRRNHCFDVNLANTENFDKKYSLQKFLQPLTFGGLLFSLCTYNGSYGRYFEPIFDVFWTFSYRFGHHKCVSRLFVELKTPLPAFLTLNWAFPAIFIFLGFLNTYIAPKYQMGLKTRFFENRAQKY